MNLGSLHSGHLHPHWKCSMVGRMQRDPVLSPHSQLRSFQPSPRAGQGWFQQPGPLGMPGGTGTTPVPPVPTLSLSCPCMAHNQVGSLQHTQACCRGNSCFLLAQIEDFN